MIGAAATLEQIKLIDAAAHAGVKRFVPSEFGWAQDKPILPDLALRLENKEKVFKYLVEKCQSSQNLTWTALATGPFLDWVGESDCHLPIAARCAIETG